MGLFGWVLEENGFPVAPLILGLVLGEMLEQNFMTSMIKSDGDLLVFFARPIAGTLGGLYAGRVVLHALAKLDRFARRPRPHDRSHVAPRDGGVIRRRPVGSIPPGCAS